MTGRIVVRDLGMQRIMDAIAELNEMRIVVGYPERGGEHPTAGMSIQELGAIHEFGTDDGHVPERSYLRSTFIEREAEISHSLEQGVKDVIDGKIDALAAKSRTAKLAARLVKFKMLQALKWATPLADSTVAAKGHNAPLDETRALINGLRWAVYRGNTMVDGGKA